MPLYSLLISNVTEHADWYNQFKRQFVSCEIWVSALSVGNYLVIHPPLICQITVHFYFPFICTFLQLCYSVLFSDLLAYAFFINICLTCKTPAFLSQGCYCVMVVVNAFKSLKPIWNCISLIYSYVSVHLIFFFCSYLALGHYLHIAF